MAINVNRGVLDPFYRYKMPKILAKVEGKGNGIKTVIANMSDIAKALERPPSYPTKYFGFELGAQTNIDLKNDRYIVNGEHDANKLQEILDGFIKKFVLCPSCDNPETALRVKKNQINSKCKACGHAFVIDSKLRLASFIVKNPPTADVVYEKAAKAADKVAATEEENGVEVETVDRHSSDGADDDDDWAEPTEEETRLAAGVGKLVISKDLEKSTEERLDMLHQYFTRAKADGKVDGKEFLNEAERLDLKQKAPLLLVEAFLDGKILEEDQLKTMRNVFLRFTVDDPKAQRYLLGGIEQLIMNHEATLLPKAAHVIKRLYDYDIVEEETLLAWGEKPSSKYVSKPNAKKIIANCEAVLMWLKDAEEESEDEDEEDDEIDFQGVSLKEDFPSLPIDSSLLNTLIEFARDWAHANGLVMRSSESKSSSDSCIHAPFSLLPAPFPASLYRQAIQVQDATARLYHRIAYDTQWLLNAHENVIKTDEFTRNLCDILKKVTDEGLAQRKTLLIQRSDYMSHKDRFTSEYTLKQVEVNNIASSMGAHAERVSSLHRRVLSLLGMEEGRIKAAIPHNKPVTMIARALFLAWKEFGRPDGVILVIVEDVNQNQIDQRHIEYELTEQGVNPTLIKRMTLTQCHESVKLDSDRHLTLGESTVSVVYFRAGYSPDHYYSHKEWDARLTIERSDAIKAPWIGLQVANTKKVQQVLAEDGQLELFISNFAEAASVRQTFAGLWALDGNDPVAEKIIKHAQAKPEGYVLKPQLEGGGGNFYGDEVCDKLLHATAEERSAYILMEKLRPLVVQSYLVRAHHSTQLAESVSELGVYGYAFGDDIDPPVVATGGHLLRTKGKLVLEGGVAVGASVIDSPFLHEYNLKVQSILIIH